MCEWVECWKVLRVCDKFNGAAAAAERAPRGEGADVSGAASDEPPPLACESDDEDEENDGDDESPRGLGGFQRRPIGVKAAKRARTEGLAHVREAKATTAALESLAASAKTRAAISFFFHAEMRHTHAARRFKAQQTRLLLGCNDGGAAAEESDDGGSCVEAGRGGNVWGRALGAGGAGPSGWRDADRCGPGSGGRGLTSGELPVAPPTRSPSPQRTPSPSPSERTQSPPPPPPPFVRVYGTHAAPSGGGDTRRRAYSCPIWARRCRT